MARPTPYSYQVHVRTPDLLGRILGWNEIVRLSPWTKEETQRYARTTRFEVGTEIWVLRRIDPKDAWETFRLYRISPRGICEVQKEGGNT